LAGIDEKKMRAGRIPLMVVSPTLPTVLSASDQGGPVRKRFVLLAALFAVIALATTAFALGGGSGLIYDDGNFVKPGSLDDGKQYLPQTAITLSQAVASAQSAASGKLGQVDLADQGGRIVYVVDVGDREVSVDAADGSVSAIGPRS
jgi:hypothetical protein